jgi:hypothetical protein
MAHLTDADRRCDRTQTLPVGVRVSELGRAGVLDGLAAAVADQASAVHLIVIDGGASEWEASRDWASDAIESIATALSGLPAIVVAVLRGDACVATHPILRGVSMAFAVGGETRGERSSAIAATGDEEAAVAWLARIRAAVEANPESALMATLQVRLSASCDPAAALWAESMGYSLLQRGVEAQRWLEAAPRC